MNTLNVEWNCPVCEMFMINNAKSKSKRIYLTNDDNIVLGVKYIFIFFEKKADRLWKVS